MLSVPDLLTTQQAARLLGVTRVGLRYLTDQGQITPALAAAVGERTMTFYNRAEVARVALARIEEAEKELAERRALATEILDAPTQQSTASS